MRIQCIFDIHMRIFCSPFPGNSTSRYVLLSVVFIIMIYNILLDRPGQCACQLTTEHQNSELAAAQRTDKQLCEPIMCEPINYAYTYRHIIYVYILPHPYT
jgi:hypothetical protein